MSRSPLPGERDYGTIGMHTIGRYLARVQADIRDSEESMFTAEQVQSLNELEREVYEFVMRNQPRVQYMRIRELATEAHVSTSTVLRFCSKMGCNGYAEFKLKLREYRDRQKGATQLPDDVTEIMDFLKKTVTEEFEDKLEELVDIIAHASNIFFVGSGMSGIVAKYGARYFSSIGKFCLYIDEPHYPTESRMLDNALAIVFSVSGESRDTISHLQRFKERGCTVVSVTNSENCTIARMSDYNIAYYITYRRLKVYDVTSQIPAMCIVERTGKKLYRYLMEEGMGWPGEDTGV